jgi:hypothetical protein
MHLFEGKMGILRLKNGLVFELMPYLAAFYLGPTPKIRLVGTSSNLGLILEHITVLTEVRMLLKNHQPPESSI